MTEDSKPIFGYVMVGISLGASAFILLISIGMRKPFITMDIGNLAVGLGTLAVAFVSSRSILSLNRQKVSEYQVRWIDELRHDTALYVKKHQHIMLARRESPSGKVPKGERKDLLELTEVRARLQMMINANSDDLNERNFLIYVSQDVDRTEDNAINQRKMIIELSRSIQKSAWKQAKLKILN
ncbi:MAG: hypothetical protein IOC90_08040 [Methylocystis sp.]|nr:hypothetical protein [Methylocystis sp.]MCA3584384.1 hypothetical protein [Methylocystis sp.]MCA3587966.1 hypothetical protein [Methylocystis sp.]MCA3592595.1 hypothetical protein [Methylocystis sp.]